MLSPQDTHELMTFINLVGPIIADKNIESQKVKEEAEKLMVKSLQILNENLSKASAAASGIVM